MRARNPFLMFCLAAGLASLAAAQSPAQNSPAPQSAAASATTAQQNGANPTVVRQEPRHVFTNEDFDHISHEATVNGGRDLLEEVNSCDRSCFDQVARALNAYSLGSKWKQSLLNAVDKSREDLPWQALLAEAISVQAQSCELQVKKRQDLDRLADPRSVTHNELLVDREYEPKFREMTRRLADVSARANQHIRAVTDPYLAEFMRVQLSRILGAQCNIYVHETAESADPRDADSPDSDDPDGDAR